MSTNFRYSATVAEISAVATLAPEFMEAWSGQLALTHCDEVAYYPNRTAGEDVSTADALRIARELQIEVTAEPVSGQQYILAPNALGGVALWRQRVGTVRTPAASRYQRVYKADALC